MKLRYPWLNKIINKTIEDITCRCKTIGSATGSVGDIRLKVVRTLLLLTKSLQVPSLERLVFQASIRSPYTHTKLMLDFYLDHKIRNSICHFIYINHNKFFTPLECPKRVKRLLILNIGWNLYRYRMSCLPACKESFTLR